MRYVTVGGLTVDNVIGANGDQIVGQFGGNAAYSSAGIRIWSPNEVGMVSRVGCDYQRKWLDAASNAGVDISGVRHLSIPHTLNSGMHYDASGARQEKVSAKDFYKLQLLNEFPSTDPKIAHQAQLDFGPEYTDIPAEYNDAQAVLLAPRYYENQMGCMRHFRADSNRLIILDPGEWYMYPDRMPEICKLFGGVDVVLPSEVEVRSLFGQMDLVEAAKRLSECGPSIVVIKVGGKGCILYQSSTNTVTRIPVYPAEVRDPTGAGDSFCGGFLVGMLETKDPTMAACYGTVTASFIIEGFGVDYSYNVTRQQANDRLTKLKSMLG